MFLTFGNFEPRLAADSSWNLPDATKKPRFGVSAGLMSLLQGVSCFGKTTQSPVDRLSLLSFPAACPNISMNYSNALPSCWLTMDPARWPDHHHPWISLRISSKPCRSECHKRSCSTWREIHDIFFCFSSFAVEPSPPLTSQSFWQIEQQPTRNNQHMLWYFCQLLATEKPKKPLLGDPTRTGCKAPPRPKPPWPISRDAVAAVAFGSCRNSMVIEGHPKSWTFIRRIHGESHGDFVDLQPACDPHAGFMLHFAPAKYRFWICHGGFCGTFAKQQKMQQTRWSRPAEDHLTHRQVKGEKSRFFCKGQESSCSF